MEANSNNMGDAVPNLKIPEGDLKDTIDKTVSYVLKNGETFETRLKTNESSKVKFPFIYNDNEYYQYYQWKLGRYDVKDQIKTTADGTLQRHQVHQSITAPKELKFLLKLPEITQTDLKIVKLTAIFAARNGPEYIRKLHKHEIEKGNKAQFQFLQKGHSLHDLYLQYVDQYKQVIDILSKPNREGEFSDLLHDAYQRAKYSKQNKVKQHTEAQELRQRQLNYASIDWQDFAVIGKIEFDDIDKVTELAVPLNRQQLVYRSMEAKTKEIELETGKIIESNSNATTEESIPQQIGKSNDNGKMQSSKSDIQLQENKDPSSFVPKGMKIKAAGESRLKKRTKEPSIKCPITGRLIPELKFDEHIRILLRDPHYEQEKQNYITKNFKYSSNLTNDEVYDNIKRLTKKKVKIDKPRGELMGPNHIQE